MDIADFAQATSKLGSQVFAEYIRGCERYAALVARMAGIGGAQLPLSAVGERYIAFVREETPDALGRVAAAGLDYYGVVLRSAVEASNRFYEQLQISPASASAKAESRFESPGTATAAITRTPVATGVAARATTLSFRGAAGERVGNAFLVSNVVGTPVDVSFEVSACEADGAVEVLAAQFEPARCTLAPGAEQVVQCWLVMPATLRPNVSYHGHIRVVGPVEMTLPILVELEQGIPPAPAPSTSKPRSAAAKAKAVKPASDT